MTETERELDLKLGEALAEIRRLSEILAQKANQVGDMPEAQAEQPAQQQEPEFFKHSVDAPYDWSEWVCPDPKSYLMKCCDCGLVHEVEFGVVRYPSETEREDCEMVDDPNLQAVFRMRRSEQWSPVDTAHRAGGLPMEQPAQQQIASTITITQRGSTRTIDNHFEDCVRDWPDGEYKLYTTPPAQQQEPLGADGWLQDGGLLYRLTDERHPQNRDEIHVTMAGRMRTIEAREKLASELLGLLSAGKNLNVGDKLYTSPPAQPQVRTGGCLLVGVCAAEGHKIQAQRHTLTDVEIESIARPLLDRGYAWEGLQPWVYSFARAIEAAHKITGESQ